MSRLKHRNIRIHIGFMFAFSHLILPNQLLIHHLILLMLRLLPLLLLLLMLRLVLFLLLLLLHFHNDRPRRGVHPLLLRLWWRRFIFTRGRWYIFSRGRRWSRRGAFGTRTDTLAGGSLKTSTRSSIRAWLNLNSV
jgi:hypothetical protein